MCVEWLSNPVRKFTRLMEAESSCSKSWAIIACTPGNLVLPEMLFYLLLPLTLSDRHDALLKQHNTYIFAMFIMAYLRNLCAICCIKSIPIVDAVLLPYSWNLTYCMPPPFLILAVQCTPYCVPALAQWHLPYARKFKYMLHISVSRFYIKFKICVM